MASTHPASEPEPLFPLEFIRQPGDAGEPMRSADVVPLKPAPPRPSSPAVRQTTRRRSLPRAAGLIPTEGDRYVSLAEAGELYSVSQETLRRRIGEGALPAVKGGYNLIRVLLSDVAKLFPPIPTVDPDDYQKW